MSNLSRRFGIAIVLGLGLTGQAFAHAHLKSATPAAGGTVAATPSELDLTLSEGVDLKFTGAKVTGPDKAAVPTGDGMISGWRHDAQPPSSARRGPMSGYGE
jgi:methionine-rich copper-binding protein CopC